MTTAQKPDPKLAPPLEDPLHEREIFANEVVGVGAVHGNVLITFATHRFDERGAEPQARRVVAARLVLTPPAAAQLLNSLRKLTIQLEGDGAAGKTPN